MSSTSYSMSMVQAAPASEPSGITVFLVQSFPFLAIFVIFYLLWIRPQARRAKEHRATIDAVKKGDDVITAGGIRGRVTKVSDDEAEVEIASGVRVKVVKATLTQVLTNNAKPAND
jgi:preprotein translocase subunit YajC